MIFFARRFIFDATIFYYFDFSRRDFFFSAAYDFPLILLPAFELDVLFSLRRRRFFAAVTSFLSTPFSSRFDFFI